jgi:hypothetical protein
MGPQAVRAAFDPCSLLGRAPALLDARDGLAAEADEERPARPYFRAGSAVWIAGGVGRFVLVDALTRHGRTRVSEFLPRADILDAKDNTTLTFGYLVPAPEPARECGTATVHSSGSHHLGFVHRGCCDVLHLSGGVGRRAPTTLNRRQS